MQNKGYGQFNYDGSRPIPAHRAAWLIYRGAIPEDASTYKTQHVLHDCDSPNCVNPEHLYLGDHQRNMDDKMERGRHRYGLHQGASHPRAKLTDDDVRAIRASTEQGPGLAERYGVTRTTIYDIRYRKVWKHLD